MVNKQNNDHEVGDNVDIGVDVSTDIDIAIKTDNEFNTSLVTTEEELTSSSVKSLSEIDWQRFDDGSYSPSSYINRDLSLLQFHLRVLAQAASPRHPLLERLFFLIIFSSNMDEFFEIRVAGIMQKLNMGDVSTSAHGMRPS